MYKIGDHVVYSSMGICKVVDIREESFIDSCEKEYYVLESLRTENMTAYYPTDETGKDSKLRDVLSSDEVFELIDSLAAETVAWVDDARARNQINKQILSNADPAKLIRLIQSFHLQKQKLSDQGKKFPSEDEKVMVAAENRLYDEFAFVLELNPDDVLPFIVEHIPS